MDKQSIINYKKGFDSAVHELSNEGKTIEYWKARELQNLLGYSKWQNFSDLIFNGNFGINFLFHNNS